MGVLPYYNKLMVNLLGLGRNISAIVISVSDWNSLNNICGFSPGAWKQALGALPQDSKKPGCHSEVTYKTHVLLGLGVQCVNIMTRR